MTTPNLVQRFLEDRARVAVVALALVLLGAAPAFLSRMQPDTAWLLYATEKMLDGSRLYIDLIEVNPPLIIWLDTVPVLLARLVGVRPEPVFTALVLVLTLASAGWSARLLMRLLPARPLLVRYLTLLILFVLLPLSREDYGQREHLFLALALPYILVTALRVDGASVSRVEAWGIGLTAGIGIALKPYFVLLWLALEIGVLVAWRPGRPRVRPESVAVLGAGGAYLLAVALLTPRYFEIVRAMAAPYLAFLSNSPWTTALLGDGAQLPIVTLLASLALLRQAGNRALWSTMACSIVALWLAAVLQQKGWRYHFYPALSLSVVLCGLIVVDLRDQGNRIQRAYAAVCFAAALFMVVSTAAACARQMVDPLNPRYDADPDVSRLVPMVRELAQGRRIMVLSWSIASAYPLITYSGVESGSRLVSLWILGASYRTAVQRDAPLVYRTPAKMSPLERFLNETVVEDLARSEPEVLVVLRPGPDRAGWGLRRLDFLEYFNRDVQFARLFRRYDYVDQVGEYWLFRRQPEGTPSRPAPQRPAATDAKPAAGLSGGFDWPSGSTIALGILMVGCLAAGLRSRQTWLS